MNSQISRFYKLSFQDRQQKIIDETSLSSNEIQNINKLIQNKIADSLIENQIGQFSLPEGVALNFIIDDKDYIIPMVTEEPSVIAACSNAAKLCRKSGGFTTIQNKRQMMGQIILDNVQNLEDAKKLILQKHEHLIEIADKAHPSIVRRGGGVKKIVPKIVNNQFLTLDILIDTKEAMGANIINTILEQLSREVTQLTNGNLLMAILSNLPTNCITEVSCKIPIENLATKDLNGHLVAEKICKASLYATLDIHRCATHNKGIMNGIEAITKATGNDTRAISSAIYSYAYQHNNSITTWKIKNNHLIGTIKCPIPIGTVGGAINVLDSVKTNLKILNNPDAKTLSSIIASVGLAQNLSALKALVSEGIQKGHMSLHAKSLAIQAGATGEEIDLVSSKLQSINNMSTSKAEEILQKIRK